MFAIVLAGTTSCAADDFTGLGTLPGGAQSSFAFGVSSDGITVVGTANNGSTGEAFRWTQAGGMVGLGFLPSGTFSAARGANADGSVIVGFGFNSTANNEAFRWTQASGMVGLGFLPGAVTQFSQSNAVNADGSVVVGVSANALGDNEAFRWTQGGGMVGLGILPGGFPFDLSSSNGVSADGSVVVGVTSSAAGTQAFRWTQGGGMVGLGFLPGGIFSTANATNADGSVVIGNGDTASSFNEAFRWTQAGGMVGLGFLPGGFESLGKATNADGSVVVGQSDSATGFQAFRWTFAAGMQSVKDIAQAAGINLTGWTLDDATGVSANGKVIVGSGTNPNGDAEAWIFRIIAPVPGFITLSEAIRSFASLQGVIESDHGALNASLGTLVEIAQYHHCARTICLNLYGLSSLEREASFDDPGYVGTLGLATRVGHDLSVGVVAGAGTYHNELSNGSQDRSRDLSGGLYAAYVPDQGVQVIAAGQVSSFDTTIDRGYHNGNTPVVSTGDANGSGWGAIVRLGFAGRPVSILRVMPFADYEITQVNRDPYTEATGPFPAAFNGIDDSQQRTRLGAEARYTLKGSSYVWGTAAWGHRIEGTTAAISGELLDLFVLSVPGSAVTQDWAEATAGLRLATTESTVFTVSTAGRLAAEASAIGAVRAGFSVGFD